MEFPCMSITVVIEMFMAMQRSAEMQLVYSTAPANRAQREQW